MHLLRLLEPSEYISRGKIACVMSATMCTRDVHVLARAGAEYLMRVSTLKEHVVVGCVHASIIHPMTNSSGLPREQSASAASGGLPSKGSPHVKGVAMQVPDLLEQK